MKKVQGHLAKMSSGAYGGDRGHPILETLTRILKSQWHHMPEHALDHLEAVASRPESSYQRWIMMDVIDVLNGLFRTLPDEEGRRRCLSVLDRFAMEGWPSALGLLRKMERPD